MDTTVANVNIKYPTDLNILNEAHEKLDKIIDILSATFPGKKQSTYRIKEKKTEHSQEEKEI